jgi:hypothetical protein
MKILRLRLLAPFVLLFVWTTPAPAADESPIVADVVYGHKDGMALTFDVITWRDTAALKCPANWADRYGPWNGSCRRRASGCGAG